MENKETYAEDDITCPKCGWVDIDSWEHRSDSGEDECPKCEAKFKWDRDVHVTYSTELIESNPTP